MAGAPTATFGQCSPDADPPASRAAERVRRRFDRKATITAMGLPNSTGISGNTERAVKSDLRIFARWCAERGETALPATRETVAAFVDATAEIS